MRRVENILIIQTAFLGDVILTLPLAQVVKEFFAFSAIDMVVTPAAANVLSGHPSIRHIIQYDKRGVDRGIRGLLKLASRLRKEQYSLALVPHRSLRSALVALLAGIPIRVGFKKGAGQLLFTRRVAYNASAHEIERNLSLLNGIDIGKYPFRRPTIHPSAQDASVVEAFLSESFKGPVPPLIAVAPGTVWNTKRWFKERFAELAGRFVADGYSVVLVGGRDDTDLCAEIAQKGGTSMIADASGRLSLVQSAELIRRSRLLVCNDSAPLHLATAVGTPIVAIFGATVPEFGFGPVGKEDVVVETRGLPCRPCAIHGGERCPIKTFECMDRITTERVYQSALAVLGAARAAKAY
jgi:heptosyltransferase II